MVDAIRQGVARARETDEYEWPFVVRTEKCGEVDRHLTDVERMSTEVISNEDLISTFGAEIRY